MALTRNSASGTVNNATQGTVELGSHAFLPCIRHARIGLRWHTTPFRAQTADTAHMVMRNDTGAASAYTAEWFSVEP